MAFLTLLRKFSLWSPRCVNSSRKLKHLRFLSGQFTCTVAVCWEKSCLVICSWNLYGIAVINCCSPHQLHWWVWLWIVCHCPVFISVIPLEIQCSCTDPAVLQLESRAPNLLECNRSWRIMVLPDKGDSHNLKKTLQESSSLWWKMRCEKRGQRCLIHHELGAESSL